MRRPLFAYPVICLVLLFGCTSAVVQTAAVPTSAEAERLDTGSRTFPIPEKIRGRVAFWTAVYGRYGKHHRVVHHRMFPQAVFAVLDFYDEAKRMGPGELERHIEATEDHMREEITKSFQYFATGGFPRNSFDRQLFEAMRVVPGGNEKYQRAIDEDLIRTQTGIKERFAEAVQRSGRYLSFMEQEFSDAGLPIELARLPFVESSFDYRATSSVGAAGLWQFMRRTGRDFGMKITNVVDERRDPIIATRAATRYLKHAYQRLGSWPLALTSYNHGVAGVAQKVKMMGTNDLPTMIEHPELRPLGFASNNFYPSFLAALIVTHDANKFFRGVKKDPPLNLKEQRIQKATSARELARKLGVDIGLLQISNYALADSVWEGRAMIPAGFTLRVPSNQMMLAQSDQAPYVPPIAVDVGKASVRLVDANAGSLQRYVVKPGETLSSIARSQGVSIQALRSLNQLTSDKVKVGQVLRVKSGSDDQKSAKSGTAAKKVKVYTVRKGDTLGSIANNKNVSVAAIKKANRLSKDSISVGQRLTIP